LSIDDQLLKQSEKDYGEHYRAHLIDIYKLYVDMADRIIGALPKISEVQKRGLSEGVGGSYQVKKLGTKKEITSCCKRSYL